jgi:hypothetical protein
MSGTIAVNLRCVNGFSRVWGDTSKVMKLLQRVPRRAGDFQWGGEGVVFRVRRLLRNDGSPDRIALNKEMARSSLRLRSKGISSVNMVFPRV